MKRIKAIIVKVKCCLAAVMRRLRFYKRLETVVALKSDTAELVYGRFDCYDDNTVDGPFVILDEKTGMFENCFVVRRISEKNYSMHMSCSKSD